MYPQLFSVVFMPQDLPDHESKEAAAAPLSILKYSRWPPNMAAIHIKDWYYDT